MLFKNVAASFYLMSPLSPHPFIFSICQIFLSHKQIQQKVTITGALSIQEKPGYKEKEIVK